MLTAEIRQAFLQYFVKHNHKMVPSSALIPINDPTLLFTNAGMVQFKNIFLGTETPKFSRATSSQCCIRAGGKHNDLENVGYTARHHTFFEMLGNFSFGDYFKREAINYAWDFLTNVLKLPPEKLWITVYIDDDEAADIWQQEIGVAPERLSRCDTDNFWSMGETGPCGPCSEIFYDHGPEIPGGPPGSANADGDRYIEIWNLVFMQYNRDAQGILHPLPKCAVDTGMGLERIASVMQHMHNNYDIDIFQNIIKLLIQIVPAVDKNHPSLKVIADHIRSCAFLIAEGVVPANEGRGYVLRRIMRRAIRHGNKLGCPTPFFAQLLPALITSMEQNYPQLLTQQDLIISTLTQEELQFARTLQQGLHLLKEYIAKLQNTIITGDIAFKLYDTYGFPVDLTADIAREHDLSIDIAGFEQKMQQQRKNSANHNKFIHETTRLTVTNDSIFHGYTINNCQAHITNMLFNNQEVTSLKIGQSGAIILDQTVFYAESGGQVGDSGQISNQNMIFRVDETKKIGEIIAHIGEVIQGIATNDQEITAYINRENRYDISINHTATHLLHAALKFILGPHVQQKGSLIRAEQARFDFSHAEALTPQLILQLEELINQYIRDNYTINTEIMSLTAARESGAAALFTEKYNEQVRVLNISNISQELCGGTHARQTGDIGLFKIITEYGVANGVRRIEFMTGKHACQWMNQQLHILSIAAEQLKTNPAQLNVKLTQLAIELQQQEKKLAVATLKLVTQYIGELLLNVIIINKLHILIKEIDIHENLSLRVILDQIKLKLSNAVIVLYTIENNKINVVVGISTEVIGIVPHASLLVKQLCGRGGGRVDMAQGGGSVPADLEQRINIMKNTLIAQITQMGLI